MDHIIVVSQSVPIVRNKVSAIIGNEAWQKAQRALEKLPNQNEQLSNAFSMGYVGCGIPYDGIKQNRCCGFL